MSKAVLEQSNYKPTEVTRQDPRWGARLGAAPPPDPQPPGQNRPGEAGLSPAAGSFRCAGAGGAGGPSEDAAEELLLPERVLGGGHGHDEGVLAHVGVAVRHQVGGCFGHLKHPDVEIRGREGA